MAYGRTNVKQLEMMIKFMEENQEFARGKLGGSWARGDTLRMWEELATSLNEIGPAKPAFKWQKTWVDWKSNTKKKYLRMKQLQEANGGNQITISGLEGRLIALFGEGYFTLSEAGPPPSENMPNEILEELDPLIEMHEEEIPAGPSALRKRKGDGWMEGFNSIEEKRLLLMEKKLELEERKLEASNTIGLRKVDLEEKKVAVMSTLAESHKEIANSAKLFVTSFVEDRRSRLAERKLELERKKLKTRTAMIERKMELEERKVAAISRLAASHEEMASVAKSCMISLRKLVDGINKFLEK